MTDRLTFEKEQLFKKKSPRNSEKISEFLSLVDLVFEDHSNSLLEGVLDVLKLK